jgi:Gpi18-like mannosyltransferase
VLALLALAFAARLPWLEVVTDDVAYWVVPWYEFLKANGPSALGREFPNAGNWSPDANYTPPYYYLLYLATLFDGWLPTVTLVKGVSTAFDLLLALAVGRVVAHCTSSPSRGWTASAATLCLPTVVANSAWWGQCDSIHTSLLVWSVHMALTGRPVAMAALFGAALAFKGQALFLAPFLALLVVRGAVPLRSTLAIPVVAVALMLPAWVMGRPLAESLTTYARQARMFSSLSMNAPNPWFFLAHVDFETGVRVGSAVCLAAAGVYLWRGWASRGPLTPCRILLAATTSAAFMPFLLPRMHDRYFFAADVLSFALAACAPRLWPIAAGFQVSSLLAYTPIISDTLNGGAGEYRGLMPWAVALNTVLVIALAVLFWRAASRAGAPE